MSNALPNHFPGVRPAGAPVCRLVMIDNYDSFTFNLVQYFGSLGADVWVFRNDDIDLPGIAALQPDCLVISPGPCSPKEAGISVAAIQHFGAAFGGTVGRSQQLMHGKTSVLTSTRQGVFANLPKQFVVNRYHSLAVQEADLPAELEVTAWTDDGEIMGLRHKQLPIEGVQFHPESVLSEHGHALLANFLAQAS